MKIKIDRNNKKDPKSKIIMGVVGLVVLTLVIVGGSKFNGSDKKSDDVAEDKNIEVVADEDMVDGEEAKDKKDKDSSDEASKSTGEPVDLSEVECFVLKEDDDKYKDGAAGFSEEDIGPEQKSVTVKTYALGDTIKLGNFDVTVNSAKKVKDNDGKDAMLIDYSLKNNSNKSVNWSTGILTHVEQGDKELSLAKLKGANVKDIKDVKGSKSMKGIKEAFLTNGNNKVYLELTELVSKDLKRALVVFDISGK